MPVAAVYSAGIVGWRILLRAPKRDHYCLSTHSLSVRTLSLRVVQENQPWEIRPRVCYLARHPDIPVRSVFFKEYHRH